MGSLGTGMLRSLFRIDRGKIIGARDFNEVWEKILEFRQMNRIELSPDFVGFQDDRGRMLLLGLYDEDRWVLEVLQEDWRTEFGKIDLAKSFDVQETLLSDEELKEILETFMTEGKLLIPPELRKPQ